MITKEEYLKAKKTFMESLEILRIYKLQPKEKYIRTKKVFSDLENTEKIIQVFENNSSFKYCQVVALIAKEFNVGENKAKSILKGFTQQGKVSKNNNRGRYFLNI